VGVLAFLTIGVALAGRISGSQSLTLSNSAMRSPAPAMVEAPADAATRPPHVAALPPTIACGKLAPWWCRRVVQAAVDLLPGEEVASNAKAYVTLVCGDDLDCPRSFLASGSPAGSVVLTLADGASAWVNVIVIGGPRHIGDPPPLFVGRIVRWFPPDA
jgi:hypothetical protein